MNIVICGQINRQMVGLVKALSSVRENNVSIWNRKRLSAFDMFDVDKPDYLFVSRADIDKEMTVGINAFKPKVVVCGVEAPLSIKEHVRLVLVEDTVPKVIADNIDHEKMILHKAADITTYMKGSFSKIYESDLGYLSLSLNSQKKAIVDTLAQLNEFRLHILGDVKFPLPSYLGVISNNQITNFWSSVSIYLDFNTDFMLECAANKTFVLSNIANPLFPHYNNTSELVSLVRDFLPNEKARRNIIKKAYKYVIENHTSFDRAAELAKTLGEESWIPQIEKAKQTLV